MLSDEEAKALATAPELAPMILEYPENYAVNEHLEHALSDFMSNVYDAWDEFAQRAEAIKAKQIAPTEYRQD